MLHGAIPLAKCMDPLHLCHQLQGPPPPPPPHPAPADSPNLIDPGLTEEEELQRQWDLEEEEEITRSLLHLCPESWHMFSQQTSDKDDFRSMSTGNPAIYKKENRGGSGPATTTPLGQGHGLNYSRTSESQWGPTVQQHGTIDNGTTWNEEELMKQWRNTDETILATRGLLISSVPDTTVLNQESSSQDYDPEPRRSAKSSPKFWKIYSETGNRTSKTNSNSPRYNWPKPLPDSPPQGWCNHSVATADNPIVYFCNLSD
ncbi:hypothetical protein IW262DRAFT_1468249 [Armillaria fumosa]|nr:hypothetical protein IW262DRAFT_1468249 [Armillaria fumosa]